MGSRNVDVVRLIEDCPEVGRVFAEGGVEESASVHALAKCE